MIVSDSQSQLMFKANMFVQKGSPTNFRKEELPPCFSDAESVLSPNHSSSERPILTNNPQYVDVTDERGDNDGEERNDNRDGGSPAVPELEHAEPKSQEELDPNTQPEDVAIRLRKRERLMKWLRPASPET